MKNPHRPAATRDELVHVLQKAGMNYKSEQGRA